MKVLGLTLTRTRTGVELDDGACALVINGACTVAIAEERLNRRKYSGGVRQAMDYCLAAAGLRLADLDRIVASLCTDLPPTAAFVVEALAAQGVEVPPDRVVACPSHHLSHAASSFLCSPFEEAVVLVADNMGNALGNSLADPLWRTPFERTSLYHARQRPGASPDFTLLSRHGAGAGDLGLGAAYHYFTRWLGFDSYHEAGQVMALAAGSTGAFSHVRLFEWRHGQLACRMPQDHLDKAGAVRRFVRAETGIDPGPPPDPRAGFGPIHAEVAGLVQGELERVWVELVDGALAATGARHVCLAGGVALNCIANTRLVTAPVLAGRLDGLFVQPASSDVGQALGNALWGYHTGAPRPLRRVFASDSLGRSYGAGEIAAAVAAVPGLRVRAVADPGGEAARRVAAGDIIGWFQGGAEFGPRALGHRSIIGDPRTLETKRRLDRDIKRRAAFRPYAPALLRSEAAAWIDLSPEQMRVGEAPLRLMLLAPAIRPDLRARVPAVVHLDGSARCQIVEDGAGEGLAPLVAAFHRRTGIPLVLNTSFNGPGEPIVETPADAVRALFDLNLDALFIGHLEVCREAEVPPAAGARHPADCLSS